MIQSAKTSQEARIKTSTNSTYSEKEAVAQMNSESEYTQLKYNFLKNKSVILAFSLLLLLLIMVGIYIASMVRRQQRNLQFTQTSLEESSEKDRKESLVLQPIEKETDKVAFVSEGNI